MPALLHYDRFKKELSVMSDQELLELAAATRRQSDTAGVGVGAQLLAAIPSHGTSLVGTAYSGPRFLYYKAKKHKIEKELQSRNLHLDSRTCRDMLVPAVVGSLTLVLGAGADAMGHIAAEGVADHAADISQPTLTTSEWAQQAADSAEKTIDDHIAAVMDPSTALHRAAEEYGAMLDFGNLREHLEHGNERLHVGIGMMMPGGEHLFSERTADLVGAGVAATAIGEIAGKGIEKVLQEASRK